MSDIIISEVTRRNLFDDLRLRKTIWSGRLSESEFLRGMFDLQELPSTDTRRSHMASENMANDVWMHRDNFPDWPDDWVYDDARLNLLHCLDSTLLRFLCEMIHPIVRADENETQELLLIFNRHLARDGYEITPRTYVSGRAVYSARLRLTGISQVAAARKVADELSSEYVSGLITRMEAAIESDPALAIGSAKEFAESICKGILAARQQTLRGGESLPQLVKAAREVLNLTASAKTGDTLRQTLSALASLTQGIAELRGQLGTGHGRHPDADAPSPTVARLSVNAAVALGVFLYDAHREIPLEIAV
jgi:hypothetical protein